MLPHPLDIYVSILQPVLKIFATFLDCVIAATYVSDGQVRTRWLTVCLVQCSMGTLGSGLLPIDGVFGKSWPALVGYYPLAPSCRVESWKSYFRIFNDNWCTIQVVDCAVLWN